MADPAPASEAEAGPPAPPVVAPAVMPQPFPICMQSEHDIRPLSPNALPVVLSDSAIEQKMRFVVTPVPQPPPPQTASEPATTSAGLHNVTATDSQNVHKVDDKHLHNRTNLSSGSGRRNRNKNNRSEWEIREHHEKNRKNWYKRKKENAKRQTGNLDIDFEGILNIIGGCNLWQILIYLMISAHQVPHAMFNLSVVYYIYQPDHWCKIENFSREIVEAHPNATNLGWTWDKVLESNIAYRTVMNTQRRNHDWHDQCLYFARKPHEFQEMLNRPFDEVKREYQNKPDQLRACTQWEYDKSVMQETVVTQWNRVCDENWSRAHVHLSYSLGYLLGCVVGGFISDRYGRKPAIFGFSVLSTIFGFLLPFSKEFEVFLIVRFLLATCNEASDLAAYVMCMEWTGVKYRSIVGSLLQAPWACGYACLALIAYTCKSWTSIQLITSTLHLLALFLLYFIPESPRWLIVMNKIDDAADIIRKACRWNKSSLPSDLELVRHAELRKYAHNKRPHFLYTFNNKDMLRRNIIIFTVWIATALVYYGLVIALSDQSSPGRAMFVGNFFLNNAIAGAIELPTLVVCVYIMRFGRRESQILSLSIGGILIFIAIVTSWYKEMTFSLILMLAGKACIQGAFNILYIFTSELYPTIIRNSAVGTCSMVARAGSGASGYIAVLSDVTLPTVPMAIFCVFSLFAAVLVWYLPETSNIPLPDTIYDAVTMLRTDGPPRPDKETVDDEVAELITNVDKNETVRSNKSASRQR